MVALVNARPERKVYLGLVADPYDALSTVAWTLVGNVVSTSLQWGAQHELATIEPTRATVTFDNADGDYEPLNASGPHYPNLRPLNRLRIVDRWNSVDYIRFTGYVTDWPRSWTGIGQASVTIQAYDALGAVLNDVSIPDHPWEFAVRALIEQVPATGKAVWLRLGETDGTVANDSSGYGLNGQYQNSPTLGLTGLVLGDDDPAFSPAHNSGGERCLLPYPNLISGYPATVAFLFSLAATPASLKSVLIAVPGPGDTSTGLYIYVGNTASGVEGKLVATVASSATRSVVSSARVDNTLQSLAVIVFTSATDFKVYVDGADVTTVASAGSPTWPTGLSTGYAVGNMPDNLFGDYGFADLAGDKLDELIVFDGLALSADQIDVLNYERYSAVFDLVLGVTSGQRVARLLDILGWPAADTAIDDGISLVQPGYVAGGALAYMRRLELTEGGRLFVDGSGVITFADRHSVLQSPYTTSQATFGEGASEIGYVPALTYGEDDADIHNDIPVGNVGGVVQVARDIDSKQRYGWRTLSGLTDLLGTSDSEARDRAQYDLALYSEPRTRIRSITVHPQNEDLATAWPALLGLGQSDLVTVKATPPGSPLITQASRVESLSETVTASDWAITLGLSATQTQEFWLLGTSELGTGTALAY